MPRFRRWQNARVTRLLRRKDEGAALLLALLAITCLAGLGLALAAVAAVERTSAADEARAASTVYAAESIVQVVIDELATMPEWTSPVAGRVTSLRTDGASRSMTPWGTVVDLAAETADVQRQTDTNEDLGPNGTRWRLFLSSALSRLVGVGGEPAWPYVLAWIGDDRADADGNPDADANGTVRVRARARGPGDTRRDVEAVVHRVDTGVVQVVTWRVLR